MSHTQNLIVFDRAWLVDRGARVAVRAGLAEVADDGNAVSKTAINIDRIAGHCAMLTALERRRLVAMAARGVDREEMLSWLLAPATRDHALLDKALFPDAGEIAVSRDEMQYDWARGALIGEKTLPVLALCGILAVAVAGGAALEGGGPIHAQGVPGVLIGAGAVGLVGWLSRHLIGGLFRTHPADSERGGQSVWRTQAEVLGRLCREGRYAEPERRRIANAVAAFSAPDRLLVQHLGASDFVGFMLADDAGRAALLEAQPPPVMNRIAASWQNPETRLALG